MTRRYAAELLDFIGPEKDVAGARHEYQRADDGLDYGYLLHACAGIRSPPWSLGSQSIWRILRSAGRRPEEDCSFVINEAIKRFKMKPGWIRAWLSKVLEMCGGIGGTSYCTKLDTK